MKELILTGLKFGRLTVYDIATNKRTSKLKWECRCDCGNISYSDTTSLLAGHTKSCGCYRKDYKRTLICAKCKQQPKLNNRAYCAVCAREYARLYKSNNIEKIKRIKQKYYYANKLEIKESRKEYFKLYGEKFKSKARERARKHNGINIAEHQYQELLIKQNYCCAICGIHQENLNKILCIDHNHQTGAIRGLLCNKCNVGLGNFKENCEILLKAKNYLEVQNKHD